MYLGIDILINRIKEQNPYDDNLESIKILYCKILRVLPKNVLEEVRKNKDFIPPEKIMVFEDSQRSMSVYRKNR